MEVELGERTGEGLQDKRKEVGLLEGGATGCMALVEMTMREMGRAARVDMRRTTGRLDFA